MSILTRPMIKRPIVDSRMILVRSVARSMLRQSVSPRRGAELIVVESRMILVRSVARSMRRRSVVVRQSGASPLRGAADMVTTFWKISRFIYGQKEIGGSRIRGSRNPIKLTSVKLAGR